MYLGLLLMLFDDFFTNGKFMDIKREFIFN